LQIGGHISVPKRIRIRDYSRIDGKKPMKPEFAISILSAESFMLGGGFDGVQATI